MTSSSQDAAARQPFPRPTLAECAVFPCIALGWEGGVSLEPYSAIRAWIERIKALPGFVGVPGIE